MSKKIKSKTKKKDDLKVVSSCVDALEAALDHVEKLQIENYQMRAELETYENEGGTTR